MWIEIVNVTEFAVLDGSLPMRECGLKSLLPSVENPTWNVTPHAGVWIEMKLPQLGLYAPCVTPHAGVWIEMVDWTVYLTDSNVTPHAGVWIEIGHP